MKAIFLSSIFQFCRNRILRVNPVQIATADTNGGKNNPNFLNPTADFTNRQTKTKTFFFYWPLHSFGKNTAVIVDAAELGHRR